MLDPTYPRTLTHARLRRSQGDIRGAVSILEALIDEGEESEALWQLYLALGGDAHRGHREPELLGENEPRSAAVAELAGRFRDALAAPDPDPRVRRLRAWLRRMRRARH